MASAFDCSTSRLRGTKSPRLRGVSTVSYRGTGSRRVIYNMRLHSRKMHPRNVDYNLEPFALQSSVNDLFGIRSCTLQCRFCFGELSACGPIFGKNLPFSSFLRAIIPPSPLFSSALCNVAGHSQIPPDRTRRRRL